MLTINKNQIRKFILGITLAVGLGMTQPMPAQALNFSFEFGNFNYDISGFVKGRILGLSDNTANQSATSVIIDSLPAVYSPPGSIRGYGNDLVLWPRVLVNKFTVENGIITDFLFSSSTILNHILGPGDSGLLMTPNRVRFSEDLSHSNGWTFSESIGTKYDPVPREDMINFSLLTNDPGAPILTPIPNPEPSTIILLGTGLAGLVAWRRKQTSHGVKT